MGKLLERFLTEKNLSANIVEKLDRFMHIVLEKNKVMNLTAITEESDFEIKHTIDSLCASEFISENSTLVDIGAGGGFPCVPLAIVLPTVKVTAVDSTAKKTAFINEAAQKLNLKNLTAVTARAEEAGRGFLAEKFDFATARAVATLPILCELIAPMLKAGGIMLCYKSNDKELKNSESALNKISCRLKDIKKFELPNGDERAIIVIEKTAATPAIYPRQFNAIKKAPLWKFE